MIILDSLVSLNIDVYVYICIHKHITIYMYIYGSVRLIAFCAYGLKKKIRGGSLLDHHLAKLQNLTFGASRLQRIGRPQKTEVAAK